MRDAFGLPQSVLVLGATSDIAGAVTGQLAARRAKRVVLGGRDEEGLRRAAAALAGSGASTSQVLFDARQPMSVARAVEEAFDEGDIDLALVAFGVLGDQAKDEHDPAATAEVVTVNFTAAAAAGVALGEAMRRQGHGDIVLLSSVAGERIRRSNFVYGSSKAGVDGFYLGLGDSLQGSGVRVMVVRPGFVRTKMTAGMKEAPLSVDAEAVANAVVRGLEKGSRVVWVPPAMRVVMSGLRHVPHALFRRLPI
jgi:decaprenylphospho-beta-D-erythro-pentofuranosid-2-ulose 2-reductase